MINDISGMSTSNIFSCQSSSVVIQDSFINNITRLADSGYVFLLSNMIVNIINSNFTNCGQLFSSYSANIDIINSKFVISSGAKSLRVSIFLQNSNLNIIDSFYTDDGLSIPQGQLILAKNSNLTIINSKFENWVADNGELINLESGNMTLLQTLLTNNNFLNSGFAIKITNSYDTLISNISISNSIFPSGYIYIEAITNSSININDNDYLLQTFNPLMILSGASNINIIKNTISTETNISNTTTIENLIYISSFSKLTMESNKISNIITKYGAARIIMSNAAMLNFTNSIFTKNTAFFGASAVISFFGNSNIVNMENNIFAHGTVLIQNNGAYLESGSGGAIYLNSLGYFNSTVTIKNCTFYRNQAEKAGGAIYSDFLLPYIDLKTVVFENNTAFYGPDLANVPLFLTVWNLESIEVVNYD